MFQHQYLGRNSVQSKQVFNFMVDFQAFVIFVLGLELNCVHADSKCGRGGKVPR